MDRSGGQNRGDGGSAIRWKSDGRSDERAIGVLIGSAAVDCHIRSIDLFYTFGVILSVGIFIIVIYCLINRSDVFTIEALMFDIPYILGSKTRYIDR